MSLDGNLPQQPQLKYTPSAVNACPLPPSSEAFVVRLPSGLYLSAYSSEHGSFESFDLSTAKRFGHLFPAKDAATILHGEVLRVLTDGGVIRIALFDERMYQQRNLSEAKQLLLDFIGNYLGGIAIVGIQGGYRLTKDQILFQHPANNSTLSIPIDIMLLPEDQARQIVREKIEASTKAFTRVRTR